MTRWKKTTMSEHQEQAALFKWAAMNRRTFPELELMFAIPNGGWRHKITAAKLKAEGVKPGVPDIFLPVPRLPYHGLFIEMKARTRTATARQNEWHIALRKAMFDVVVSHGWEQAVSEIMDYLSSEK